MGPSGVVTDELSQPRSAVRMGEGLILLPPRLPSALGRARLVCPPDPCGCRRMRFQGHYVLYPGELWTTLAPTVMAPHGALTNAGTLLQPGPPAARARVAAPHA